MRSTDDAIEKLCLQELQGIVRQGSAIPLSIGFEFETNDACCIKIDTVQTINYQRKHQVRQSGMPVRLSQYVHITGDHVPDTCTKYARQHLRRFVSAIPDPLVRIVISPLRYDEQTDASPPQTLQQFHAPRESLRMNRMFGSLEWIVTFEEQTEVPMTGIFSFMMEKMSEATGMIRTTFHEQYETTPIEIVEPSEFPMPFGFYSGASKTLILPYDKGFFSPDVQNDGDYLGFEEWRYLPQCTLGVRTLQEAYSTVLFLYGEYVKILPRHVVRLHVEYAYEMMNVCRMSISEECRYYLFLFFYSFLTRDGRKTSSMFVFRWLFSDIWERTIGIQGVEQIVQSLRHHEPTLRIILEPHTYENLMDYFKTVHSTQSSSSCPLQQFQCMRQSTFIPGAEIFLIEFRSFYKLFKDQPILLSTS